MTFSLSSFAPSLKKEKPHTRLFVIDGQRNLKTQSKFWIEISGVNCSFSEGISVVMPQTLVAGTDYAIYACLDGSIRADVNFSSPTGYYKSNSKFIGCAHFAPGENAIRQQGGTGVPAFNPYSLFDLTYRPSCSDWRGMTTDQGEGFCTMIYFLNQDPVVNGASRYGMQIATDAHKPTSPPSFGNRQYAGAYGFNYYSAVEILSEMQLRLPTYSEFTLFAYGVTEEVSVNKEVFVTGLEQQFTSGCGVMQATGVMWTIGADLIGQGDTTKWVDADGRGQTIGLPNVGVFGGHYISGSKAGSRGSTWTTPALSSAGTYTAVRGVCDLMILD